MEIFCLCHSPLMGPPKNRIHYEINCLLVTFNAVCLIVRIYIYLCVHFMEISSLRGLSIFWLIITVILYLFCLFSIKNKSEKVVFIRGFTQRIFSRLVQSRVVFFCLEWITKHQRRSYWSKILECFNSKTEIYFPLGQPLINPRMIYSSQIDIFIKYTTISIIYPGNDWFLRAINKLNNVYKRWALNVIGQLSINVSFLATGQKGSI